MEANLAKTVSLLAKRLEKLEAGKSGNKNKNKNNNTKNNNKGVYNNRQQNQRMQPGVKNCQGLEEGTIRFSRHELVSELKADAQGVINTVLPIVPTSMPLLKKLAGAFERSRWLRLSVYYVSATGTMKQGSVQYGIDWDYTAKTSGNSASKVVAYTPSWSGPIWQARGNRVNCPRSRLQGRSWYLHNSSADDVDKGPGQIVVYAAGLEANMTIGNLWVQYEILMSGTTA